MPILEVRRPGSLPFSPTVELYQTQDIWTQSRCGLRWEQFPENHLPLFSTPGVELREPSGGSSEKVQAQEAKGKEGSGEERGGLGWRKAPASGRASAVGRAPGWVSDLLWDPRQTLLCGPRGEQNWE